MQLCLFQTFVVFQHYFPEGARDVEWNVLFSVARENEFVVCGIVGFAVGLAFLVDPVDQFQCFVRVSHVVDQQNVVIAFDALQEFFSLVRSERNEILVFEFGTLLHGE